MNANRKYRIFGIEGNLAAQALAWALWKSSYIEGTSGSVSTGAGSSGADYNKTHKAWVLHNTAWWGHGGAHKVVVFAAERLRKQSPKSAKNIGDLSTFAGDKLIVVEDENQFEAAIWEVAGASYDAWQNFKEERRIKKAASEVGESVELFRLTHEKYFRGFRPALPKDFAEQLLKKFGEVVVDAVNAIWHLAHHLHVRPDDPNIGGIKYPLIELFPSLEAGENVVSDSTRLNDFGVNYVKAWIGTQLNTCWGKGMLANWETFGVRPNIPDGESPQKDSLLQAMQELLSLEKIFYLH